MDTDVLDRLLARVDALEQRVRTLEQGVPLQARGAAAGSEEPAGFLDGYVGPDVGAAVSGLGKALLVVGGAYVLRAITDAGVIPPAAGVAVGLAYAVAWSLAGGYLSAAGLVIGFPLVVESALRYHLVGAPAAAALLALLSAINLGYAWKTSQHVLAWLTSALAVTAGLVLMVQLAQPAPFALLFTAIGVTTLWLGYTRGWFVLRWPVALVANLAAAGLTLRAASPDPLDAPSLVIAVQTILWASYLASIAVRTLALKRRVIPFEIVQTVGALAAGLGGAALVTDYSPASGQILGAVTLVLAITAYVVAFAFAAHREGAEVNFHFYATLALVLAVSGTGLLFGVTARALLWAAAGGATAWAATRFVQPALAVHASIYVFAAAAEVGLISRMSTALLHSSPFVPGAAELAVLAAGTIACVCLAAPCSQASWLSRIPAAVLALMAVWAVAGLMVGGTAAALSQAGGGAGAVAALRTVTIAGVATGAARIGRANRGRAFTWLMYPLLAVGGISALLDLRVASPAALVLSLAAYGSALLVAPRIGRARLID